MAMEYTEEQLNNFDKATLVQLFLVQQLLTLRGQNRTCIPLLPKVKLPIDNHAEERSIRPLCVGKKNWVMIDTIAGA